MAFTGKQPRFETTIFTDQGVGSVSNPPSGAHKLVDRSGVFKVRNSSGTESNLGSSESLTTITNNNYTVLDNDGYTTILFSTGSTNRTCTLPTAADNSNRVLRIIKSDSDTGTVTIDGEGSETIDGATTRTIAQQYESYVIQCNGSAWFIIDHKYSMTPVSITPTYTGFGTPTSTSLFVSRRGKHGLFQGRFTVGTSTGVATSVVLPSGYAIDTNYISTAASGIGVGRWEYLTGTAFYSTSNVAGPIFFDGSTTGSLFFSVQAGSSGTIYAKELGNVTFGGSTPVTYWFEIPIAAWEG